MPEYEKPAAISADVVMQVHRATRMGIVRTKGFLTDASPLLYSRLVEAAQTQSQEDTHYLHDPIEDDPEIAKVIQQAEQETEEAVRSCKRGMGFCHLVWNTKQQILKEKYGIEWFTPVEMNPAIIFD